MADEKKKSGTGSRKSNGSSEEYYTGEKKQTRKKAANQKQVPPPKEIEAKKDKTPNPSSAGNQFAIVMLVVMSLFIVICFAFKNDVGVLGKWLDYAFFGLFGLGAFCIPFILFQMALFWKRDVISGAVKYKYIIAFFVLLFASVMGHTIYSMAADVTKVTVDTAFRWETLKSLFYEGKAYHGGGFLGGLIANSLICAVGYPGTLIFGSLFLIAFGMSLFGLTPVECLQRYQFYRQRNKGIKQEKKEQQDKRREEHEAAAKEARARKEEAAKVRQEKAASAKAASARNRAEKVGRTGGKIDSDIFDDNAEFGMENGTTVRTEALHPISEETLPHTESVPRKVQLDDIFDKKEDKEILSHYTNADDRKQDAEEESGSAAQMELVVKKTTVNPAVPVVAQESEEKKPAVAVGRRKKKQEDIITIRPPEENLEVKLVDDDDEESPVVESKKKEYEFPPLDLLQKPVHAANGGDINAELRENADKIIQTLESFRVHVNISNVSRGPTITRYEVEPAPGTRVSSINNLLEDIALALATSGVRSDGIIAGKSAIGIEVPNKTTSTVFVRELIENPKFENAKSKLTTSLGMDVSGAPVYLDVAKMPHLLIAGATGQGKSVCINSLIISILYKARPDEVKLILVDPKKVELNIYNGLPHLLIPVVFDPKKAAGSLHWAVQEMERRFELLEAKNVRNLAQYNAAIANDPNEEKIPQIVIIIDELADLMMSAPDDVEVSVCRLAQKARAAGMHLIIGTQRPSVDVITGLIKANIPSRIAFTVSSQIDSRTIIDMQGAEKLIGRGDMLFAPVGTSKPVRVQGAFVSEDEIENVVNFIKSESMGCSYADDVIEEIEKAAALCGQKKGKGQAAAAAGGEEEEKADDPMLEKAIELAVDSGKISTSLIQRTLSLGYGRAAKLIDVMERRGYVSAPDGQKPRTVLINKEQYLELKMLHESENTNDDAPPFDV